MRKFVLTVFAVAALAVPAAGQVGDISTYSDAAGLDCNVLDDTAPFKFIDVYIFHKHAAGGVTGSQFKVQETAGSTMTFASFTGAPGTVPLGDVRTDLSIGYGGCRAGDVFLGTIRYIGAGTSQACSYILVTPAASTPIPNEVVAVDCAFANVPVATGQSIINPDLSCQCNVAVSESTWGGIKALYR